MHADLVSTLAARLARQMEPDDEAVIAKESGVRSAEAVTAELLTSLLERGVGVAPAPHRPLPEALGPKTRAAALPVCRFADHAFRQVVSTSPAPDS